MLGCGYLITMVGPDHTATPWGYTAFQIVRSVVLSTQVCAATTTSLVIYLTHMQGLVISLAFCYMNSEVQSIVQAHYTRWQLIRGVGKEQGLYMSANPGYGAGRERQEQVLAVVLGLSSYDLFCIYRCA